MPVRGSRIAGHFGIDLGATRQRVFQIFENHDPATARDDKAVAIRVKRARGGCRRVVVFRRHGAHGVKQARQCPVELFPAAGEHHVLLAQHDLFGGIADAVQRGRAGRGDRVVDALDLVSRREVGGDRRRHTFRHGKRTDPFGCAGLLNGLMRRQHGRGRRPARPGNQTRPLIHDLVFGQACIGNGLAHGDMRIGRTRPHEPQGPLVHVIGHVQLERARDLAAESMLDHIGVGFDTGCTGLERGQNLLGIIPDGGDNPQTGNDDTPHARTP